MYVGLIGITLGLFFFSLFDFMKKRAYRKSYVSLAMFMKLVVVMVIVMLSFAVLYYLMSLKGVILVESLSSRKPVDPSFMNLLYFSGETLLSVGYGDMLPVGATRFFAMVEALIGMLLPAATFMKALHDTYSGTSSSKQEQG
ncbi:ion channel [Marinicrinis sediminis]|uniref:Ion channel n=1 Tax=Marinicrinis sediminis TaxID=1652465 RepID=A0ABW5R7R2_9BACL